MWETEESRVAEILKILGIRRILANSWVPRMPVAARGLALPPDIKYAG